MARENSLNLERFEFRGLHPRVHIGTASDRYGGWIGQIYSREKYKDQSSFRTHKVGGKSFKLEILPVESVDEYFTHFRILEIDYTFYQPLLDEKGEATRTLHILDRYGRYLQEDDSLILKAPQAVFAQKLLRGRNYLSNEDYLNAENFTRRFYEPAKTLLGSRLRGIVFEQEYQRAQDRRPLAELSKELDGFFAAVPRDTLYHVELRTESYLAPPVFEVMEKYGVGQVLSHWTWLPPLQKQLSRAGGKFMNAGKQSVIRLMTPLGTRYEEAYARAYPFDRIVEEMFQPQMVEETVRVVHKMIEQGMQVSIVVNNRAGGNAPLIAQKIAQRLTAV